MKTLCFVDNIYAKIKSSRDQNSKDRVIPMLQVLGIEETF